MSLDGNCPSCRTCGVVAWVAGSYFHFSNGIFSQSWLWFLPVLLLFNVLYLCSKKLGLKMPNISFGALLLTMIAIGIINNVSFVMFEVTGWTKTWILDFQKERLIVNAKMF